MALPKAMVIEGCADGSIQLAASSSWDITGGFFFAANTSGTADQAEATDTVLTGFVEMQADPNDANLSGNILTVPSSTSDKYRFNYHSSPDLVVRMPVASGITVAATYSGILCDLNVTSYKQTVDPTATSTAVVQVMPVSEEDIALNMVRVKINPAKFGR
jgi:hypothetical protein